jgi:pyruvate,orthophosphate dikinase
MSEFYVIAAGRPLAPGGAEEVGNKAWNLMLMAEAGLAVPPAFVLPTVLCSRMLDGSAANIDRLIDRGIAELEALTGRGFGSARRPLLLSVRSGAAASMPGMMETVLNLGLNDDTCAAMLRSTGNPRLVWDSYRRLIESYGEIVGGLPATTLQQASAEAARNAGVAGAAELDFEQCRRLVRQLLDLYRDATGRPFPQDVRVQVSEAIRAVFRSWNADKAVAFRRLNNLQGLAGTAVTVQSMVFGNMSGFSGSGVAFTRDPSSGANELYLDFAFNAQGEDIVAGRHALTDAGKLGRLLPAVRAELEDVRGLLERRFGDTGFRVHRRGRQAVAAADQERQAHAVGGVADRGGPGEGRLDLAARGAGAGRSSRPGVPGAAAIVQRRCAARPGSRHGGGPGCCRRPRRLRFGQRIRFGQAGYPRHPGAR